MCSSDIFLGLIAILFPPIAVWIKRGICSADSLINLALCCLGFIPGLLHAWYIIARYPEDDSSASYNQVPQDGGENGNGNVTYYYVAQSGQRGGEEQRHGGYGTTGESMRVGGRGERSAQAGGSKHAGAVPPSYEQAVGADNKVQT